MNKVILIGRLTKDPEIRSTSTGKKVASFSIAVNDGKNSAGEDMTQFFNCSAWEKLADIIESYVNKGIQVGIVGQLKNRSWDGPDGTKRYATDITVRELEILTTRSEAQAMQSNQQNSGSPAASSNPPSQQNNSPKNQDSSSNQQQNNDLPEIDVNDLDDTNVQMPF